MPFRRLDDRIRELCVQAVAADTVNFVEVLAELRATLHEHAAQLQKAARQQLALAGIREIRDQIASEGGTVMSVDVDKQRQMRVLIAKIETEEDQKAFMDLIHELNHLLDAGRSRSREKALLQAEA